MLDDMYIEFARSCRVDKDETMEALSHDVDVILQCHDEATQTGDIVLLPYYMLRLSRKKRQGNQLYQDIISIFSAKQKSHVLIDIMPLVDSYLEYMCL